MTIVLVCVVTIDVLLTIGDSVSAGQEQGASSGMATSEKTDTAGNLYHLVLCETRADYDHWYILCHCLRA